MLQKIVSLPNNVESSGTRLLNIGCGHRFSRDPRWVNVDLVPASPEVRRIDASGRLPFEDQSFDGVYHSHVLEHLDQLSGRGLLQECFRVLRPSGVLRIAIPDLEGIARNYIDRLSEARNGTEGARRRHEWAVLELCDQLSRVKSGGGVIEFLRNPEPAGRNYAIQRCGAETRGIIESLDNQPTHSAPSPHRLKTRLRALPRKLRESLVRSLLGREYPTLLAGRFNRCGELHRWMYDAYSISNLLHELGFVSVKTVSAAESRILGWSGFKLDGDESGAPHKPDSLFVEAIRPMKTAAA